MVVDYAADTLNNFSKPLDTKLGGLSSASSNFFGGQYGQMQDYLKRYQGAIAGQQSLPDLYKRIGTELNLPALQQNANTLNTTMANLPGTYGSATRGFDVNSNQLARTIGQKATELQPAVNTANLAYQNAQGQANTQMGFEQAQQAKELLPYQTESQMLGDYQARQATGFTTENQQELNGYITKLQAGITLTEGERGRANQLAIAEKSYKNALDIANISASTSKYATDAATANARQANLIALAGKY